MKLVDAILGTVLFRGFFIIILLNTVIVNAQGRQKTVEHEFTQKISIDSFLDEALSIYEIKHLLLKTSPIINPNPEAEIDQKTVFLVLGAVSFAGFIVSVLFFNSEIFSTMPLILLGVSVLCVFLGV
jgi:hypothetical protein